MAAASHSRLNDEKLRVVKEEQAAAAKKAYPGNYSGEGMLTGGLSRRAAAAVTMTTAMGPHGRVAPMAATATAYPGNILGEVSVPAAKDWRGRAAAPVPAGSACKSRGYEIGGTSN